MKKVEIKLGNREIAKLFGEYLERVFRDYENPNSNADKQVIIRYSDDSGENLILEVNDEIYNVEHLFNLAMPKGWRFVEEEKTVSEEEILMEQENSQEGVQKEHVSEDAAAEKISLPAEKTVITIEQAVKEYDPVWFIQISNCEGDLSVRILNMFKTLLWNRKAKNLGGVLEYPVKELLMFRNFGKKSLSEFQDFLKGFEREIEIPASGWDDNIANIEEISFEMYGTLSGGELVARAKELEEKYS